MRKTSAWPVSRAPTLNLFKALAWALAFADGFATMVIYFSGLPPAERTSLLIPFGCEAAGIFLGTLVHELGHAAAATICGWRVIVFMVKPFAFRLPNPCLVLAGRRRFPKYAGFVSAVPGELRVMTPRRRIAFIAGGPAASLAFGIYLACMAMKLHKFATPQAVFLAAVCMGFALHSLCVCARTLLPRTEGDFSSDGARLLRALSRPAELRASVWLAQLMKLRVRPREIPDWMIQAAQNEMPDSENHAKLFDSLAVARMLDAAAPDFAEARRRIEAFRTRHGMSDWLCACDAYVLALHEADVERAKAALAAWQGSITVPELTAAARAAISAREGKPGETEDYLAQMQTILRIKSPFPDACYADIGRRVEALLQIATDSRRSRWDDAPSLAGSVPDHAD